MVCWDFRAEVLANKMSSFSFVCASLALFSLSFTFSCMALYSSLSFWRFSRRIVTSLFLMAFCLAWSRRRLLCRSLASRSRPRCCSPCALASAISALACMNCRFAASSFSSFFKRISSWCFCCFFCCILSATSRTHFSRYCCCASSLSFFCLRMASCLCCDSSLALSRILARVSAFSVNSCCFSSFFSSCLSRFSSSSLDCRACVTFSRSRSSAKDISSSKPWQGCSAGSKALKRSTGTFSKARI
mmetsp:Transcript_21117/g.58525  ORF Transcript_21117/g.58525 Transcript_21117/m.58525 type:complete len:245 (-) Transcript_21117:1555-2289(-)